VLLYANCVVLCCRPSTKPAGDNLVRWAAFLVTLLLGSLEVSSWRPVLLLASIDCDSMAGLGAVLPEFLTRLLGLLHVDYGT
jgi:hypothetical protein